VYLTWISVEIGAEPKIIRRFHPHAFS